MATSNNGRAGGQGNLSPEPTKAAPVDIDAERAVLGGILLYGTAQVVQNQVRKGLVSDSFYYTYHGDVFAAMVALAEHTEGIDAITVYAAMERSGTASDETKPLLESLAGYVPVAGHTSAYTRRVLEMAEWRARQKFIFGLQGAIEVLNEEAWQKVMPTTLPEAEDKTVVVLRTVVDEHGAVLKQDESDCPSCVELRDEVKGLNRDLTTWRIRCANLERDKEADARANGMWQLAQRLFLVWKQLTNHMRSDFTATRFYDCEPYLRNKKYGPTIIARGIVGISHDPFVTTRRNGTKHRHDGWDLLFRNTDKFEEYVNCAPKDWETKIPASARPFVLGDAPVQQKDQPQAQLRVV